MRPLQTSWKHYLLPEETVFVDHVVQFGWHVPRLKLLLPRLKTFPVQDPIVGWQRNLPAMQMFFRMNTSTEENLKPNMFLEEFRVLPPSVEELCLSLPCTLELKEHSTQGRSAASELITALQLLPEEMLEDAKTSRTGLFTTIYPEGNVIEQNAIPRNADPCKEEDAEKAVCFRSYHDYKLEVPITPPCSKPKDARNKDCITLTAEELSPVSTTFHSLDADKDILESLGSHSAVQTLCLKVPLIKDKSEHLTIEEVKCRIPIQPDTSVDLILEEDWSKLGSNMKNTNIIEQVKTNVQGTEDLSATEIESFETMIGNKLEGIFEKKISPIRPKTIIHKWNEQSPCNVSSVPVINPWSSQNSLIFMDACKNTDRSTGDDITVVTDGQKTDQPKVSLPLLKFEKLKQYLTPSKEILSVTDGSQASTSQQRSCHSYKSLDGGLSGHDTQAKEDLLSHFIALRTRNTLDHSECKYEENVLSQANDEQKIRSTNKENVVFCNVVSESLPEEPTHQTITVHVTPSGNKSDKDEMIFKNAALLHILVTLRDLVLMCSLDATLEYLCKAQEKYKSVFGPYLDGMWRKLRIVQFVREKAEEPNPKVTALLKWMEKANVEYKHLKVLLLTQTNSKTITEYLDNICSKTGGLRAIGLCPADGNTFLETKDVLDSLRSYSCVISKNQYIGSSFPWAHFSLVVEYDCTDYWLQLCQKLNVSHITLKTSVPDTQKHDDHQHRMRVPYVLLTSELINNSELLHILESRHDMSFLERSSNRSLHLFGGKSQCTVITVDVSNVIIIQELEEIVHDKSAENLILKLVALSLQYSCCWVLLYQKKSNQSEYSLSGDILHGICLIYAAIIPLTAKSEDVEIKHFSDITALHQLSLSASSPRQSQTSTSVKHAAALQGHPTNVHSPRVSYKNLQSDILLGRANTEESSSSFPFQRSQSKDHKSQPLLSSVVRTLQCYRRSAMSEPPEMVDQTCCTETDFGTCPKILKWGTWSVDGTEHLHQSTRLQGKTVDGPFPSWQHSFLPRVSYQSNPVYKPYEQESNFSISQESVYADLLSKQNSRNPSNCGNELTNAIGQQAAPLQQTPEKFCSHLFPVSSNEGTSDAYYSRNGIAGKRRVTMDDTMASEGMSAEKDFTELSQLKRKKLSYEKVPGRCDGQTRLKFF
ncbi:protein shortage in chiasmata 1 ortholog isoform X2 [Eleutherodactylus coqui]|uniref:protein shortage in chiasmata 1 ortholog isoform X2 n=1 Tax=Eleutherodactylus coqui TaxID=57060 RepID=UPI0034634927